MTEWVTPQRLTSGVRDDECTCLPLVSCDRCEREAMDLSPAEAATVARFDAAPDAEESLRRKVARTLHIVDANSDVPCDEACEDEIDYWLVPADAVIQVMRGDDA